MIIFLFFVNNKSGDLMKIIKNISKIIVILFSLLILGILIVSITIDNSYNNDKICRTSNKFLVDNYTNISNLKTIKVLDNCDKIIVYLEVDESIDKSNVNGIILQFVNSKKKYNDYSIIELIIKNSKINFIVIIDEEERIDIDYES